MDFLLGLVKESEFMPCVRMFLLVYEKNNFFKKTQMKGTFRFYVKVLQLNPFNHFLWGDHNFLNLAKQLYFLKTKLPKLYCFIFSTGKEFCRRVA
jgi:hypothetical protein